jgi:hypothetical protein
MYLNNLWRIIDLPPLNGPNQGTVQFLELLGEASRYACS